MRFWLLLLASVNLITGALLADTPEQRKSASIEILKSEGVPFIDHLPVIEDIDGSVRRTENEVVNRALALLIVAVKGETRDEELVQSLVAQYNADALFSPYERAFIDNPTPSEQEYVNFIWRYESAFVLLWAVGFVDTLEHPDHIVDVYNIAVMVRDLGADGLRTEAKLRSQGELLQAADLIYRYNWAVVNARLKGKSPPAGLDSSVVYERHYALNWLIGYGGQPWDHISTDT